MLLTEEIKDQIRTAYQKLASTMPGYRRRPQQMVMIAEVAKALGARDTDGKLHDKRHIALVNGPTGVGKTFGYLIPAVVLAKALKRKAVISTGTVNLQEQLFTRDIPNLKTYAGLNFRAALVKGRGRYVCLPRLERAAGRAAQTDALDDAAVWDQPPRKEDIDALITLAENYGSGKWDGDRDTLKDTVPDRLWSKVTNDGHGCSGSKCAHYRACAFYKARRAIQEADILIANHDLVLASMAHESNVLPKPSDAFMIFDEAHHLPEIAIAQGASAIPLDGTVGWLQKMPGAIGTLAKLASKESLGPLVRKEATALVQAIREIRDIADVDLVERGVLTPGGTYCFDEGQLPASLSDVLKRAKGMTDALLEYATMIATGIDAEIEQAEPTRQPILTKAMSDTGYYLTRLTSLQKTVDTALCSADGDGRPFAKWLSMAEKSSEITFSASPVHGSDVLRDLIWNSVFGATLVSATMTALGSFDWFIHAAGLDYNAITETDLPSPFRHDQQGELVLPRMKASPKNADAHTKEVADLATRAISETTTGTLILCTSRKQMGVIVQAIPDGLRERVMAQGDFPKQELLRRHRERVEKGQPSVIIGLASFGEGVDLPGKQCDHVVICKLPFAPPDTPVEMTLSKWMKDNGGDPFGEISLPKASLKLIQWTGRLIRTEEDIGRVTVLDSRLGSTGYGQKLIAALPPFRREDTAKRAA